MAAENKVERRDIAVLYAELRNFTRLSEVLEPAKVWSLQQFLRSPRAGGSPRARAGGAERR